MAYMCKCLPCKKEHEYKLTLEEAYASMKLVCPECKTPTPDVEKRKSDGNI